MDYPFAKLKVFEFFFFFFLVGGRGGCGSSPELNEVFPKFY
jgi:hypothetical protein